MAERHDPFTLRVFAPAAAQMQAEHPEDELGQMNELPAIRIGIRTYYAFATETDLVIKVGEEKADELIRQGIGQPVAPSGRPLLGWVRVYEPTDEESLDYLQQARAFVAG